MELEFEPEGFADDLFGEVVVGGPQTTGGDDEVGARFGKAQNVGQATDVVADDRMVIEVDPEFGEALGNILRVGVGDLAEQKLGADGNDLSSHFASHSFLFGFSYARI